MGVWTRERRRKERDGKRREREREKKGRGGRKLVNFLGCWLASQLCWQLFRKNPNETTFTHFYFFFLRFSLITSDSEGSSAAEAQLKAAAATVAAASAAADAAEVRVADLHRARANIGQFCNAMDMDDAEFQRLHKSSTHERAGRVGRGRRRVLRMICFPPFTTTTSV